MPAAFGEDSDLCEMLRLVAPQFEHRIFLSATPHNGHTRCFTGLLEILDPVRFSQTDQIKPAERERMQQVVLRRLKREINIRSNPPRFCSRQQPRPLLLSLSPLESALSSAFDNFRTEVKKLIAGGERRRRRAGSFAVEILGKRLLSCPTAFAESWRRCKEGLAQSETAADAEVIAAEQLMRQETGDDRENQSREATAASVVGSWLKAVAEDLHDQITAIDQAVEALGLTSEGESIIDLDPKADARFDSLRALTEELLRSGGNWREDERLVVFTEYKTTLDYIVRRLRKLYEEDRILTLFGSGGGGGMDEATRDIVKNAFNDPSHQVRILVATDAAAEGLNLQGTARYLLHFDCPWNPSRLEQRNGRLDRHGQARDVTIHHFVSRDDPDLRFLAHVLRKADEIREDLGSANELFDEAAHRKLVEGESLESVQGDLDRRLEAARKRAAIAADDTAGTDRKGFDNLEAIANELDLDPIAMRETLEAGMAVHAGRPQLDCAGEELTCRLVNPGLPGWSDVVDDSLRLKKGKDVRGPVVRLAFSPEPFLKQIGQRLVYTPRPDVQLMHLSHPMIQRALGSLTRRRFPGTGEVVSRWTVRLGDVPPSIDALVLLSLEELAVNELRESFHHWVRTVAFPVRNKKLLPPLEHKPPSALRSTHAANYNGHLVQAQSLFEEIEPDLKAYVKKHAEELTSKLKNQLEADGAQARKHEDERYRSRQGEVSTLIAENTLAKLEREINELKNERDQGLLFDEAERLEEIDRSIEERKQEIARRTRHYEEVRTQLERERLRHGGLLLDPPRLKQIGEHEPTTLSPFLEGELRRQGLRILQGNGDIPSFVAFVLKDICGFSESIGRWHRGSNVSSQWGRVTIAGDTVKPRQLWQGSSGGLLPVFFDAEKRIGVGRGKKITSQVLQWLRAGQERMVLVTNGRQWRLVFAGLDFDAWCEWDLDLWFEEGELSPQVIALRTLLSPSLWIPSEADERPPLLRAIQDSRKGQAELSNELGERVRKSVELVVQTHGEVLKDSCSNVDPAEIYRAAVRIVMRLVVVLFAESRELLPRDNAFYHGSYGLTGLLEELEKTATRGGNRLARSWNAWPRILSLFRLVHQGSHHPDLTITAYGGELFASAEKTALDGLARALFVFENACFDRELMSDRDVHHILELITRTRVKLRQGRSSTWVVTPVDFSDLSSEYIGILYEGLLDFELRTAPEGDPVIFLAVGNHPALPLSRLEAMDDRALATLLEKMRDTSNDDEESGEGIEEDVEVEEAELADEPELAESEAVEENEEQAPSEAQDESEDEHHLVRTRAEEWARRAVVAGNLVRRPRGQLTPERRLGYEESVASKARQLVSKVILPGEWYLVRWGGTRKGGGTFYTRPGLAVPTVQRTLRPLAYDPPTHPDGSPDRNANPSVWIPKVPEEILGIKVCDPACGSGSFPVAALRFLTDALYSSLHAHRRIQQDWRRPLDELLGLVSPGESNEDLKLMRLPCGPEEGEFEQRTKAVLRRYVVERSIYGVDLDPLAVELCRLALWIETMDRTLPFSFLDHKIKCGNSLIGGWFDQFQHYPAMAWKHREGGDKNHNNGVHSEKEARTKEIKAFVREKLTPDLKSFLQGPTLFNNKDHLERARTVHEQALQILSRLHELPVQDSAERARVYREELIGSDAYLALKAAMDLWCACWFWPVEELEHAPLPTTFHEPSEQTIIVLKRLAASKLFFHWELEFPDVFRVSNSGFDAIIGNPPWETLQPNSKEFFSNIDPLYRSYGKQEALRIQTTCFSHKAAEEAWLAYNSTFDEYSNWMKFSAQPFGDPNLSEKPAERFTLARGNQNIILHDRWRQVRLKIRGFADGAHPFRYQGQGKAYTYKLFLEHSHSLLRSGGRVGFIVPSGLYSDYGTQDLRKLFLEQCNWEWLFGFENRERVFEIDSRFKFNPVIVQKGSKTDAILTAFMRRKLEDWERAEELSTPYKLEQVSQFSPKSRAILEIQSARDLEILEKIYKNSVLLGDDGPDGWGIKYTQGDFNMTSDSKLFPPRPKWEEQGYRPDEYSRWLKGNWRPIEELWPELGVKPLPEGERRVAQPPYDTLPIPRGDMPPGVILSRVTEAFICEDEIETGVFTDSNGRPLTVKLESQKGQKEEKEISGRFIALPLHQGVIVSQFDHSTAAWISGTGLRARWEPIPWDRKRYDSQFLVAMPLYEFWNRDPACIRLGFRDIARSTDFRTFIASLIPAYPCGNVVGTLSSNIKDFQSVLCQTNSFVLDWSLRRRMAGTHLNWFVVDELPVLRPTQRGPHNTLLSDLTLSLNGGHAIFAPTWLRSETIASWRGRWALTPSSRIQLRCVSDAIVAACFGLTYADLNQILAACDIPSSAIAEGSGTAEIDVRGFWRVDKNKDPELRHTILTLVAFHDLEERIRNKGELESGIEEFIKQNAGRGWMIPDVLRLADYALGHDDRAKEYQPVASRLGPRLYDWQLAQSAEESWRECHLHARNLLGETGYRSLLADIEASKSDQKVDSELVLPREPESPEPQQKLFTESI